jgi:hypothetical protein
MQIDLEEIAKKIDTIALSFEGVEKKFHNKAVHTSYFFENQCLFYLKEDKDKLTFACHKGYLLEDKFDFVNSGKYMRHIYITNDFNEEIIKSYIDEAIICSIELNEKNKLKQYLKRKINKDGYSTSD